MKWVWISTPAVVVVVAAVVSVTVGRINAAESFTVIHQSKLAPETAGGRNGSVSIPDQLTRNITLASAVELHSTENALTDF